MKKHILLVLLLMIVVLVLSSSVSATPEEVFAGLSHYYNFSQTSGALLDSNGTTDSSSVLVDSQTATGIRGNAWNFEGDVPDCVRVPNTVLAGKSAITVNVWVKLESIKSEASMWSYMNSGTRVNRIIQPGGTTSWGYATPTTQTNLDITEFPGSGEWVMYTSTYDDATNNGSAFINGTFVGSITHTGVVGGGGQDFTIGNLVSGGTCNTANRGYDGLIDELGIWDRALNASEIDQLYNGGTGIFFPIEAAAIPQTPTYQPPTPADNAFNNTNQTINCTTTAPTTNLRFYLNVSLEGGGTDMPFLFNVTATAEGYRTFETNFSDGKYTYDCFLQNISNGVFSDEVSRTLTIDTVNPTITLNPTNAFNTSNLSSHNQYLNFMFLNISFNDEAGLFGVLINITKDGVSQFNHTNTSLNNALSHNFTRNLSTVTWSDGVYDINITVVDGSTVIAIDDYEISQFFSRITFDTLEGNEVDIIGSGALSTEYTKKRDRYEFAFNYLTKETTRKFTIKCDNELFYMNNPRKTGHFVCWNERTKTGNWVDFEGVGGEYIIKKIKDKEYDITFTNLPLSNKVYVKSIGGLNVVTENYQWFKGSTTNTFSPTATSGSNQVFEINITLDFNLVKNISARFIYNESTKTITRTDFSSNIIFNSTFNVPDANETLNFSWFFNVTQKNDALYSFSLKTSQELVSPQVNLTVLDEENQSLITEDLTIFFTGPSSLQTNTSSGTLSIGNLILGEYFIQAESTTYPRRGIFFTVTNASSKLNLYLVQDVTGNSNIDYIVQDDGRNRLNNVRLTFQKSINNSFVTVAQIETDFAGQARIFQDQQNEYKIVMSLIGFETQTIDLIPLLTQYTLTLLTVVTDLFETTFEGIRYTISPAARVVNASGVFENFSLTIFDGGSSLEFFGLQIINNSYTCIPANCITNISGSPAGGTAVVQINLTGEGSFDTLYFYKRNGFPLQFINGQRTSVRFLIGDRLEENFRTIGDNLGTPVMRSIFAAILITVLVVLASQIGVIGLGLMFVISFGTIFFMLLGFIPRMVGMITLFFGIAIYFVLGREQ